MINLFKNSFPFSLRDFVKNSLELFDHEVIVDHKGQLSALLVILACSIDHFHMLLFSTHVIVYYHLHIQSIVSLLLKSLFQLCVWVTFSFWDLFDYFTLYFLYEFLTFHDLFNCFFMFVHFTQYCCFVQVCWYNIVFLLIWLLIEQCFLNFQSKTDTSQSNTKFSFLFVNASQIIKSQYFYFA